MSCWHRTAPFDADRGSAWDETWEYAPAGAPYSRFKVRVRAGKPLDVLRLKGADLGAVRAYAAELARNAGELYGDPERIRPVAACPICRNALADAPVELRVHGVDYRRCPHCGHVGVGSRPDPAVLDRVFAESEALASTYIDRAGIEIRLAQVVAPKLDWCRDQFRQLGLRAPASALDVGAGGGHFLAAARRAGLQVEGFELSRSARAFAEAAFGLELRPDDFLAADGEPADLVTFWGLLEYVARPRDFLAAARRRLAADGLLVVEIPRVDALGTRVQAMDGAVVARHMDPCSHVNGFTDASICTALVEEGFAPVAAWYFGMDAYEACMQAALAADDARLLDRLAPFIPELQAALDRGRQCDDLVIAARPLA